MRMNIIRFIMHALSMYEWVWLINDNEWVHYGLKVQRCRENNGREERRGEEGGASAA